MGRNTGPAVLAAALWLLRSDPDAIMLVAPSDHVVPDTDAFCAAVANGLPAVAAGDLVTFGIAPTRAETGYGYLEQAAAPDGSGQPVPLRRFVEKPDAAAAAEMLAAGNYLWNAGIFLFSARAIVAAFQAHAPEPSRRSPPRSTRRRPTSAPCGSHPSRGAGRRTSRSTTR